MLLPREFMGAALAMMRRHDDAWPFRDPVSRAEVPDYYDIIRVGRCLAHMSDTTAGINYPKGHAALQRTRDHDHVQHRGLLVTPQKLAAMAELPCLSPCDQLCTAAATRQEASAA